MVRLRLTEQGIVDDASAGGRGAWLCAVDGGQIVDDCLARAVSSRSFDRAFRVKVDRGHVDALMSRMSPPGDGGRVHKRR